MESITIKVEESLAKDMDLAIKNNRYSTRTEFIREAIRKQLTALEKEQALKRVDELFGKGKGKTTYEEERMIREKVGNEILRKFGLN